MQTLRPANISAGVTAGAPFWDPRLDARGAVMTRYIARPGNTWYKLVRGEWLDPSQGKPTILVDVIDEQGKRIVGAAVRFSNGGETFRMTEAKPNDRWAVDHPMHAVGCAYSVEVAYASDRISCLGLGSIEDPDHAHHSGYYFVFQRTTHAGGELPGGPTVPDPPAPGDLDQVMEALAAARHQIDIAMTIYSQQIGKAR